MPALSCLTYTYMSKLDEYILTGIKQKIENLNAQESRKKVAINPEWMKWSNKSKYERNKARVMADAMKNEGYSSYKQWPEKEKNKYDKIVETAEQARKRGLKVPYTDKSKTLLRSLYVRYADDWVLLSNVKKEVIDDIKSDIASFLEKELKLELSQDKTKITNLKKDVMCFLGFRLGYYAKKNQRKYKSIRETSSVGIDPLNRNRKAPVSSLRYQNQFMLKRFVRRTTGNNLIIGIDYKRLEFRYQYKGFIDKTGLRGIRKRSMTTLTEYQIVQQYNYMIAGFTNYFAPSVNNFSELYKYIYLLNSSCYHTLANKYNCSIRKIFKKFGRPLAVKSHKKTDSETKERKVYLMTPVRAKHAYRKVVESRKAIDTNQDFTQPRINWRTAYKLTSHCVVCGSNKEVQMHHVKHVRKGKIIGFGKILSNLNRKQIPVCKVCHIRIHRGLYDSIGLSDIYDPDLATY